MLPKNKSTAVTNAPLSSVVNDCARGSHMGLLLIITKVLVNVSTLPSAWYVVSPELINKLPGSGSAFTELDVSLNVLIPVLNLNGGGGTANGSLKKNDP